MRPDLKGSTTRTPSVRIYAFYKNKKREYCVFLLNNPISTFIHQLAHNRVETILAAVACRINTQC